MRFGLRSLFAVAVTGTWLGSLVGCSGGSWSDTFVGKGARSTSVGDASTNVATACQSVAGSKPPGTITVSFPGYGTATASIHIVASAGGSCDLVADSATDGFVFTSNALPCAALLAPGSPSFAQVTATGGNGPNDMTFQWGYDVAASCAITDDYPLSKQ